MINIRYLPIIVNIRQKIPHSLVNRFKHFPIAILANIVYGWPSSKLTVIGVTGTEGKTTTAIFLYHLLKQAGYKVVLISTIAARIGNQEIDTGFHVTAPDHFPLQALLKRMVDKGLNYVVLEVTSHGIKLGDFNLRNCSFVLPVNDDFNKLNLLAAIKAAQLLGLGDSQIRHSLTDLALPRGRMEIMQEEPFLVIIDF